MRPTQSSPRLRWLPLPPRVALGFGAAVASLFVAAGASYAALSARTSASRLVRHTAEARHAMEEVESALLVSRTALEAYLVGEQARHRERFLAAAANLQPAIEALRHIAREHPEQEPRVEAIVAEVAIVRADAAQVLALASAGDLRAARSLEASGLGRGALERATVALAQLEAYETRLHEGLEAAWNRSVALSNAVFVAALVVLLALVLVAARLVHDDATARDRALVLQQRIMGVVSHDLRSPLTAILASAGALARTDLPDRAATLALRIVAAGTRMERLIRDLLDWSRVQGGGAIPISPRPSDLADVCRRMADELRGGDPSRIEVFQEGDTRAVFDPERMEQVVGNLLSNAVRHGQPGAPVHLRAVGTREEVRVEVENQGPEIPAATRAEIFEPFRQGPDGRGGVGLGLFIVRAVAEAHGGAVKLHCEQGRITFVVHLPRAAAGPSPRAE